MKDFDLKKYLTENKLSEALPVIPGLSTMAMDIKLEQNPFEGDVEGLFLSSDGGKSGVLITTDQNFDITDYEMDGDEVKGNLNGMNVRIISVYG